MLAANAQVFHDPEVFARAESLSTAVDYVAVVTLLGPYVQKNPSDTEAWLSLARHQYWSKDLDGARRTYEAALHRHPSATNLRIAFASFLTEIAETGEAADILRPLGKESADAEALRGTLAWWAGDLTSAARYFQSALATEPAHPEALAALSAIRAESRPWIRIAGQHGTDSQPLSQSGASTEAGFFMTPLTTIRAEIKHTHFVAGELGRPISSASAAYRTFWPAARIEMELASGIVFGTDSADLTGRLDAGFRFPFGIRIGGRWERTPYLYTVSSISERIMTVGTQLSVSADREGWLGEVALSREYFPDENTRDMAYGWLMAPLIRKRSLILLAGYTYGYQSAAENRFTPVLTGTPRPGNPPVWEGRYIPYYTPLNYKAHSVTGSITLQPVRTVTLRARGSYGFFGSEKAPFVYVVGRAPMTGVYDHKIRPWNISTSVSAAISPALTLHLEGAHMATTWYDASTINLSFYARI